MFFTDLPVFSPSLVSINGGGTILSQTPPTILKLNTAGTVTLSPDRKQMDIVFASPVAPGSFFDVHAPIEGLVNTNSFQLSQYPTVVPEPAAYVVWSLLGAAAGAVICIRRRAN